MTYYLIEIAEGDAKIAGKGIYQYADRDLAIANFHTKMGNAMKSALFSREQVMVINSANGVEKQEVWTRPVPPEPEPEPEPTPEEKEMEEAARIEAEEKALEEELTKELEEV